MGFLKKRPARTIPQLNPDFYTSIRTRLAAGGGEATQDEVGEAVRNAVYNTSMQYHDRVGDQRAMAEFDRQFGDRFDAAAADDMIDWMVALDPGTDEFLGTLVGRLDDVLSRPG